MGAPKDPKKHAEWRRKISEARRGKKYGPLSEDHKKAISKANKKTFSDPEMRAELSERTTAQWADPNSRSELMSSLQSEESRAKKSRAAKKMWEDPERREHMSKVMSDRMQSRWDDPEEAAKLRAANAKPSSRRKKARACASHWEDPEVGAKMLRSVLDVCSDNAKRYKHGEHFSPKTNSSHHYRSSYELRAYQILDADPDVALYIVEPLAIPYTFNGKQRRYIPDLYVEYLDGSWAILEIKPEYQLNWPSVQAKIGAARAELPEGCFGTWSEQELAA